MIAVLPSMIHPKTAVLGRAGGVILCNEFSYVFIGCAVASENEERRVAA